MADKRLKRCSPSQVTRDCKWRRGTPVCLLKCLNSRALAVLNTSKGIDRSCRSLLVGIWDGTAILEAVSYKGKHTFTMWLSSFTLWGITRWIRICIHTATCTEAWQCFILTCVYVYHYGHACATRIYADWKTTSVPVLSSHLVGDRAFCGFSTAYVRLADSQASVASLKKGCALPGLPLPRF